MAKKKVSRKKSKSVKKDKDKDRGKLTITTRSKVKGTLGVTKTSAIKVLKSKRRKFASGARRQSDAGKGLPSLCSPIALRKLAQHMQGGVEAGYDPRNWEKGLTLCSILDSIVRHILDELEGKTDEDHANCIQWNAHIYMHTKELVRRGLLPPELDDRQNYIPKICPIHRKYKGTKAPTNKCDICQMMFENRKKK